MPALLAALCASPALAAPAPEGRYLCREETKVAINRDRDRTKAIDMAAEAFRIKFVRDRMVGLSLYPGTYRCTTPEDTPDVRLCLDGARQLAFDAGSLAFSFAVVDATVSGITVASAGRCAQE